MQVAVIGHRCNSGRVTLFYKAVKVPIVEIDVCSGASGELLVRHGPSEVRRASVFGQIFSYIDYKLFYRDPILKVRRVEEHLRSLSGFKGVLFDVKRDVNALRLAEIIDNIGDFGIGSAYVSTTYHPLIKLLRELTRGALLAATLNVMPVDPLLTISMSGADAVSVNYTLVTPEFVETMHAAGVKVLAWTVNDCREALKLVRDGVDALITDRPDLIMRCLRREGVGVRDYV